MLKLSESSRESGEETERERELGRESIERYANEFAKCQGDSFIELISVLSSGRETVRERERGGQ